MITSANNPTVKHIRALQQDPKRRREAGAFVVEGVRLAEEALMSGWPVKQALYTEALGEQQVEMVRALHARGVAQAVSTAVMKAASDTKTPQGVLLEVELRQQPIPKSLNFVLILDGVADPGNQGTLLRSAAAANCDAVFLAPGCADAFSPKVLRSGMGAHFRQPVQSLGWGEIEKLVHAHKLQAFLAEAWEGRIYDEQDLTAPLALILGGEARGAGTDAARLKPKPVQIPMPGRMESMNVAAAGSILLFEVVRQRRKQAAQP